jgi:hypothetical protein
MDSAKVAPSVPVLTASPLARSAGPERFFRPLLCPASSWNPGSGPRPASLAGSPGTHLDWVRGGRRNLPAPRSFRFAQMRVSVNSTTTPLPNLGASPCRRRVRLGVASVPVEGRAFPG